MSAEPVGNIEFLTPEEAARLAVSLREQEKQIAIQLTALAAIINASGRAQEVVEGSTKYIVRTSTRKTLVIDDDKMRLIDPEVYGRCLVTKVDHTAVRRAVEEGRAVNWTSYAQYKVGRPFVTVTTETVGEDN